MDELPETLDETYERALLDIDEENWAYAHRLFQCIVVARRPLLAEELAEFLAFKSEEGINLSFQKDWRPENPRDTVLSTCSSLISVVNVAGSPVIQFSHFSVKEYLTSSRIAGGRVSRYYIPLEPAHIFVTQACLCFLLQLNKHVTKRSIKGFPLARYAGQYWADHAESGDVSRHTEDMIQVLFNPEDHYFAGWVWIYDTILSRSDDSEGPPRPGWSPLHLAARHGFHGVVEWLITACSQDVNVSGDYLRTPVHIASEYGQFKVVQVLLANHADVNASDNDGLAPLHFASWSGHLTVARVLLEHSADVNFKTRAGRTALSFLSENHGNLELAQILLDHGADPNPRSITGKDSLYMALRRGHQRLAQLLLKYGAEPNAGDVNGRTLLHVSSKQGDPKVTKGLLELGVDVNTRDNRGQTPLQVALEKGDEQVVQLLLEHGAK